MAHASRSLTRLDPDAPLTTLPGIGPAREAAFARRGLFRVRDLYFLLPRRWTEWHERVPIAVALERDGAEVTVRASVESTRLTRLPGRRSMFVMRCSDASGALEAVFFNQPWLRERYSAGMQLELHGRVKTTRGTRLIVESVGSAERPLPPPGAIVPRYSAFEGFSESFLAQLVQLALPSAERLVDSLDPAVLARHSLPPLARAVELVHAPPSKEGLERGRARLALEPLLALQAKLAHSRASRTGGARAIALERDVKERLRALFPFTFTAGQTAVVREIRTDLSRTRPMRRLLQGDVGCGKTAVAAWAACAVASAGGQVAFLAPTEVLAEQHHQALAPILERAGASSVLLTASLSRAERKRALARIASGAAAIAFGTHALFSADVSFERLDLAIIDEQQRFGVGQRLALSQKGSHVHLLLMTATPIPRTLAHTLYGDLDSSTIHDRPAGRGSTTTRWLRGEDRDGLLRFLEERLEQGERAFWVCPRLGETSDESDAADESESAERRARLLRDTPLARFGIELVHGQLERDDRVQRLEALRSGRARLLVATSVIEVGVDVPEATVLVVEGAERFGLAQLHQLRGRVGRGPADSWCFLLGPETAAARLELLERESSGFLIAEEDLRQRGMGELAGLRQSGEALGISSDLGDDVALLVLARDLVREDPRLVERYSGAAVPEWTEAP